MGTYLLYEAHIIDTIAGLVKKNTIAGSMFMLFLLLLHFFNIFLSFLVNADLYCAGAQRPFLCSCIASASI